MTGRHAVLLERLRAGAGQPPATLPETLDLAMILAEFLPLEVERSRPVLLRAVRKNAVARAALESQFALLLAMGHLLGQMTRFMAERGARP